MGNARNGYFFTGGFLKDYIDFIYPFHLPIHQPILNQVLNGLPQQALGPTRDRQNDWRLFFISLGFKQVFRRSPAAVSANASLVGANTVKGPFRKKRCLTKRGALTASNQRTQAICLRTAFLYNVHFIHFAHRMICSES